MNIRSPVHQQLTLLAVIEIQLHDVTREGDASLDTGHTTGDLLTRLLTKNQSHSLERNHDPLHETCTWLITTHCTDSTLFDVTFGHKPKLRLKWKGRDYSYIHCILLVMILIYYKVFNKWRLFSNTLNLTWFYTITQTHVLREDWAKLNSYFFI